MPDDFVRSLPANPDFRHLRLQAKSLQQSAGAGDSDSLLRMRAYQSDDGSKPSLSIAQLAIAREYGYASWTKLKIDVEHQRRSFADNLQLFLSEGWRWGDDRRALHALECTPDLADANIYSACLAGEPAYVESFLKAEPQLANQTGGPKKWPPILYATWSCLLSKRQDDFVSILRLLLAHGADASAFWKASMFGTKESALYGCVDANCDRAARVLLEAGAEANDGESLYHACEQENLAMLQTLGEFGLKSDDVSYCIKHAMDYRWDAGIQWFIEQGADPNAVHPAANETSLHWAIKRNCSAEVIRLLLDAGADPQLKTKLGKAAYLEIKGSTPYDYALRLGRRDIAELLRNHGATAFEQTPLDAFVIAAANGEVAEAKRVLAVNPRFPDPLDHADRVLICHVAQCKRWSGVRLMVELGWRPDQKGGWMGATPLSWALCYGETDMVRFLLEHGADASAKGDGYFGSPINTVLHCRWADGDHDGCLQRLLDAGATIPAE